MKNLNRVSLIGRLTADPELKALPDGTAVCNLSLATNYFVKKDDGDSEQRTNFHKVTVWRKLAEICEKLFKKGNPLYIEGRLSNNSYTSKDGTKYIVSEVTASDVIGIGSAPKEEK